MKKIFSEPFTLALILSLFLTGCSSGYSKLPAGGDMGMNSTSAETMAAMAPAAAPYDVFEEPLSWEGEVSEEGIAEDYDINQADNSPIENASLNTSPQEITSVSDSPSAPLSRKLIRNMNLTVETTDFDPLIEALQKKTTEFKGYIEQSDISGDSITNQGRPSKKYAQLLLRIPAQSLDSFISQVESAGNITYKSETVSDVTLQYSDIQSRLKTLRIEQERLWELLAKAESTESIVLLEKRLTEVSSEIESCESRTRYLDTAVTYSTVHLEIQEVDIESPTQPETAWQQIQRGFTKNLISLMDNLTLFFIRLLSNLPVILFLALLVFLIVFIVRRVNKHKKSKAPQPFPISQMNFFDSESAAPAQKDTDPETVPKEDEAP